LLSDFPKLVCGKVIELFVNYISMW